MSDVLLRAARELYGTFNNGGGVTRPLFVHETLADVDHEQYGLAVDGVISAIDRAYQASEDMVGYKAHSTVSKAAHAAVEASGFTDSRIAKVSLSEISAVWIVETSPDPELVQTLAGLVIKSRPITREFLKLFWWDDALDID